MKMRAGLIVTCAASALFIGSAFTSPAPAAELVTKAPPMEAPAWWYEGYVEVGYRDYLNDPDKHKLGKFYEYRDLSPGVFGNFYIAAHRTNPIDIAVWGKNVGYEDQAFGLDYAKVGDVYLSLMWDQTPHVFAKNARTTFGPIGDSSTILSTPTYPAPSAAAQAFVDANSTIFDLKYRRDTASVKSRWTPTDNWDFTVSYSHMHRHGTQGLSATTFNPPAGRSPSTHNPIEFPKPVDDVTQNGNVKGEYVGTTPWSTPFNVALSYAFSLYRDDVGCGAVAGTIAPTPGASCVSFQNPWVAAPGTAVNPLWNRYSLWPDNEAHTVNVTGGVGLPFKSRYMGTFQYSWMKQNDPFLPSTINPVGLVSLATVSATSLNGDARTTLFNNVLHTQVTDHVRWTNRYRFYRYDSQQMPVTVTGWPASPDTNPGTDTVTSTPANYSKQNASSVATYRPTKWLNLGAGYEWERWWREIEGVDVVTTATGLYSFVTNEQTVKAFGDARLWDRSTFRASIQYGERRFDGDYIRIANNNNAFRTRDFGDRNRTAGQASWAFEITPMLTVTPVGGFRVDNYQFNPLIEFGINKVNSWNAGGDVTWAMNHRVHFYVSYTHEDGEREVYQRTVPSDLVLDTRDHTDTVVAGTKITVVPDKLFVKANYTYTTTLSQWASNCGPGGCWQTPMPTFPDSRSTNQRVDIQAKYVFDKIAGWTGRAFLKARVVLERNRVNSWQSIDQQLGWAVNPGDSSLLRALFLATGSPNYEAAVGMVSFGVTWP
jgi:MtrB/PioB family decaheme-associated outer membrane protein